MSVKKPNADLAPPLQLRVPHLEIKSKLETQVKKGNQIKQIQIASSQKLQEVKSEFQKWDDFNKDLLEHLFTNNKFKREYSVVGSAGRISLYDISFREETNFLHEKITAKTNKLESFVERLELIPEANNLELKTTTSTTSQVINQKKIFIVHGHDNEVKQEVARFIDTLNFEPIILHEQPSAGATIIEKIEQYSDVGFGVVLYTPCDIGANASEKSNLLPRARQNVVFEHGFLIGKLGRKNVCALVKGDIEKPNDISGVVYVSMDNSNGWKMDLAKELKSAGYTVDMNLAL